MTLITRCPYAANVLAVQNQGMNLSKVKKWRHFSFRGTWLQPSWGRWFQSQHEATWSWLKSPFHVDWRSGNHTFLTFDRDWAASTAPLGHGSCKGFAFSFLGGLQFLARICQCFVAIPHSLVASHQSCKSTLDVQACCWSICVVDSNKASTNSLQPMSQWRWGRRVQNLPLKGLFIKIAMSKDQHCMAQGRLATIQSKSSQGFIMLRFEATPAHHKQEDVDPFCSCFRESRKAIQNLFLRQVGVLQANGVNHPPKGRSTEVVCMGQFLRFGFEACWHLESGCSTQCVSSRALSITGHPNQNQCVAGSHHPASSQHLHSAFHYLLSPKANQHPWAKCCRISLRNQTSSKVGYH